MTRSTLMEFSARGRSCEELQCDVSLISLVTCDGRNRSVGIKAGSMKSCVTTVDLPSRLQSFVVLPDGAVKERAMMWAMTVWTVTTASRRGERRRH